jgi:MFS family permease
MLGHMSGLLFLAYATGPAMIVAYAILHGTAWGLRGPFMQAIRADYFGRSAIGMIMGLSFMIIVIGQIGGPMIAGILADITGNYRAGFTTLALLAGLGSAFFLLAKRPARRTDSRGAIRVAKGFISHPRTTWHRREHQTVKGENKP